MATFPSGGLEEFVDEIWYEWRTKEPNPKRRAEVLVALEPLRKMIKAHVGSFGEEEQDWRDCRNMIVDEICEEIGFDWKNPLKYKSLKDLQAAYASGELSKDNPITVDNDCVTLYSRDEADPFGEDSEELYSGGFPDAVLHEALRLLGIPSQSA